MPPPPTTVPEGEKKKKKSLKSSMKAALKDAAFVKMLSKHNKKANISAVNTTTSVDKMQKKKDKKERKKREKDALGGLNMTAVLDATTDKEIIPTAPTGEELKILPETTRLQIVMKYKMDLLSALTHQMAVKKTLTKDEMDRRYQEGCSKVDMAKMYATDAHNYKGEDDPAILIGAAAAANIKKGQMSTSIDPYHDVDVVQVGILPADRKWIPMVARFDYNHVFSIQEVFLPTSTAHPTVVSYWAWIIAKVKQGKTMDDEMETRSGKKVKPFNFSGRIATLPEFHLALRRHVAASVTKPQPTPEEIAADPKAFQDDNGIIDMHSYTQPEYSANNVVGFGDYRTYIEESSYKTYAGNTSFHKVLTLTKKKSPEALAKTKGKAMPFFMVQIPVRNLVSLIRCVYLAMVMNGMQVLNPEEIAPGTEDVFHQPPAKVDGDEAVQAGNEMDVSSSESESDDGDEDGAAADGGQAVGCGDSNDVDMGDDDGYQTGSSSSSDSDSDSDDEDETFVPTPPPPPPVKRRSKRRSKTPKSPALVDIADDDDEMSKRSSVPTPTTSNPKPISA